MRNYRLLFVSLVSMMSVACAKTNFTTQWSLKPTITPENASFTEFQRRESERRHEVAALKSERREIGQKLDQLYDIYILREPVWTDGDLNLTVGGWYKEQKLDVIAALERSVVISERLALLTNRPTATDLVSRRTNLILNYVKTWQPKAIPYYR